MKIIWSPLAVSRLEEIFNYISYDNIAAAEKLVETIFNKVDTLANHPERGRRVPEVRRNEIREIFEKEYRIIYRIEKSRISILTIRNFKQILYNSDFE